MRDWDFTISRFEEVALMASNFADKLRAVSKDDKLDDGVYSSIRIEAQCLHAAVEDCIYKLERLV